MEVATYADPFNSDEPSLTVLWGTWELWCDLSKPGSDTNNQNWLDQVRSIGLFDSAEGYWGLFNCTLLPSQLPPNSSYYLFRKHIAPMWEHEANRRGGKWVMSFNNSNSVTPHKETKTSQGALTLDDQDALQPVDAAWQKLSLAMIGELFPGPEEEICGLSVSHTKKGNWKLALWTRTASDEATQLQIGQFIKELVAPELQNNVEDFTHEFTPGATNIGALTPERRIPTGTSDSLTYVAHREIMLAKKQFSKGSPSKPFQPKYTA